MRDLVPLLIVCYVAAQVVVVLGVIIMVSS